MFSLCNLGNACVVWHTSVCLSVENVHLCCPPAVQDCRQRDSACAIMSVDFWVSDLNVSAFLVQISTQHLPLSSYIRACSRVRFSMCVFSAGWGSICVRLTHWEPLPAGSPGGSKSYGRPEAQNPSRPGQMSLCWARLRIQRPHRPLRPSNQSRAWENVDQTAITSHLRKLQPDCAVAICWIQDDFQI